jgi:tRNA threonylcarbamoyl adenosine modification protein (Sua5/YciO/YrdC/YwlC family)
MSEIVLLQESEFTAQVAAAVKKIRAGYVIVAPLEHSYVYLCDAFQHDAVRTMHVMRGDVLGVAAQVLISDANRAVGIIRDFTTRVEKLTAAFWPGLLSLTAKPQLALSWDLGDDRNLDQINVRVPIAPFVRAIAAEVGPLAAASATESGQPAINSIEHISIDGTHLALIFDGGVLPAGSPTTIIETDESVESGLKVQRIGAISIAQIMEITPEISTDSNDS